MFICRFYGKHDEKKQNLKQDTSWARFQLPTILHTSTTTELCFMLQLTANTLQETQ